LDKQIRLVNEAGLPPNSPTIQRNEQATLSEAKCHPAPRQQGDCLDSTVCDWQSAKVERSSLSPTPSFLVHNKDNVNSRLYWASGLKAMWDFKLYKGRIDTTNIILNKKGDPSVIKIIPATVKSRYFEDGRLNISRSIKKRFGRFKKVPGLMLTLTYDPKRTGKQEAWASFGKDTRRFLNSVNQYRKRRAWKRLHYFWVVEVQKQTGYPHVHIFFPNLKWLAPVKIINGNWRQGRANIASPKQLKVNCIGYICKYLNKMKGWTDLHLALLWIGKGRMYGFSRGYLPPKPKKESDWQKWHVVRTKDVKGLQQALRDGGFTIEENLLPLEMRTN
jgi:hypothetical protein